ncbi:MAG: hypothetical protein HUK20_06760, partial [Fibrobacter sp.]|nr:hypothetical protein [Fibrobacter sp.]
MINKFIYKRCRSVMLAITAFFWASCSEDSEAVALYGVPCTQENGCCEMGDDCGEPSSSSSDME